MMLRFTGRGERPEVLVKVKVFIGPGDEGQDEIIPKKMNPKNQK